MTGESVSELIGAEVVSSPSNTFRIVGVYRNEPMLSVRQRSVIHNGAVILEIVGTPATKLKGHYWTDRSTAGEIELTDRLDKIFHDFETARLAIQKIQTKSAPAG